MIFSARTKLRMVVLLLTASGLNANVWRFNKGELLAYPSGTAFPVTSSQAGAPTTTSPIKGTIRDLFDPAKERLSLQIFFRANSSTSYKDAQILELEIPFVKKDSHQNKTLIYKEQGSESGFKLGADAFQLYALDPDFHVFRGSKNSSSGIKFKQLEVQIYHGKKPQYYIFELFFEQDEILHKMVIDSTKMDQGSMSHSTMGWILFPLFTILLLFLKMVTVMLSIFTQQVKLTYGSLLFVLFLQLTWLTMLRYRESLQFDSTLILLLLFSYICDTCGFCHAVSKICSSEKKEIKNTPMVYFVLPIVLVWVVVLIVEPSLVLRAYGVFMLTLLGDFFYVFGLKGKEEDHLSENFFFCGLIAFLGLLTQGCLYMIFFSLFYSAHLKVPEYIFTEYLLVDFGIFMVFLVILVIAVYSRGKEISSVSPRDRQHSI